MGGAGEMYPRPNALTSSHWRAGVAPLGFRVVAELRNLTLVLRLNVDERDHNSWSYIFRSPD